MSRRHKRARGHVNHERWLVSYADFITLLFAFFVVLYASAQVDHRKIGRLAMAIQAAFGDTGDSPSGSSPFDLDQSLKTMAVIQALPTRGVAGSDPEDSSKGISTSSSLDLSTLESELQQSLQHEIAKHAVTLHRETEGLVLSLQDFGFFDSGSAAIKPSALPALDRIASILALRTCSLRIEGHTDNVPIHTAQMASNWELSSNRATELVRLLILRYRFGPERLSAAGYAQYHPIASNATAQGRAQNRRVDIVILGERVVQSSENATSTSSSDSSTSP